MGGVELVGCPDSSQSVSKRILIEQQQQVMLSEILKMHQKTLALELRIVSWADSHNW